MKLSIIIVSWNVSKLLEKCLESIIDHTQGIEYEIFVVDNASKDNSVKMVMEKFPDVNLIGSNTNLGFARANNLALEQARGEYVLFMNPDMELTENSFPKLINLMDKDKNIALSTCQLNYPDETLQKNIKNNPGFYDQLLILLKLHHLIKPKCLKQFLAKNFDYTKEQEVKQIMGAFVFSRGEIIKKIDGWDDNFFIWWEDLDLCKQIQELGLKIIYTPITKIIHHESKCFAQQLSLEKQKRFNKGMQIYFKKHHNFFAYLILSILSPVSLLLAWISQIIKIKPKPQSKI